MDQEQNVFLRCDDHAEIAVFTRYDWEPDDISYTLSIQDAYCGGDYMGIRGRFKRAWNAFWAKPIHYSEVLCEDGERMKSFLKACLAMINQAGVDDLISCLDRFKNEHPDQVIIAETPNGTVQFKIGEALIYEGMGGEVVMDSE